jgi:hypothetical protein
VWFLIMESLINNESERMWKKTVAFLFEVLPRIFLVGLREVTKIFSRNSRSPRQDFNPGLSGYISVLNRDVLL